jgi:protein-S-isoprenylcysteine O-methyltransferase Ste14
MATAIVAYLLMAGFFGLEFLARKRTLAKSVKTGPSVRGTTILLGIANTTSTLFSLLFNLFRVGDFPQRTFIAPLGIVMMVLGLSVRLWAILTLGQFYTRTLRVSEGQQILEEGPYRLIRHPGYLGTLLTWVGLPLALSNWLSAILVTAMIAVAFHSRIRAEEAMLIDAFGDQYRRYIQRTSRLLPFIL